MAKRELMPKAEELYVRGAFTFQEIADHLGVSDKTVRTWADKGGWRDKKKVYLEQQQSLDEKIYTMLHVLADGITKDLAGGVEPSKQRAGLFAALLSRAEKAHQYEDVKKADQDGPADDRDGLSDEAAEQLDELLDRLS